MKRPGKLHYSRPKLKRTNTWHYCRIINKKATIEIRLCIAYAMRENGNINCPALVQKSG